MREVGSEDAYLSVIVIGELIYGVRRLADGKKRRSLETWLSTLQKSFAERILSVDVETTHVWGELTATQEKKGKTPPPQDGLIAATAIRHGLRLMTRNARHLEDAGVLLIDPWAE